MVLYVKSRLASNVWFDADEYFHLKGQTNPLVLRICLAFVFKKSVE